jgi:hypothetical protein
MGQHRPVQVFNLVTRGSIEERVLKTLELKRSLFDGVFAGTADEVSFEALGKRAFLDTVRDLVQEEVRPPAPVVQLEPAADPRQALVQTGVQFLEALAGLFAGASHTGNGTNGKAATNGLAGLVTTDAHTGQPVLQLPLPSPQVLQRGAAALQTILAAVGRG